MSLPQFMRAVFVVSALLLLLGARYAQASQLVFDSDLPARASSKLRQYAAAGKEIDLIAFTPRGDWVLVADNYRWYSDVSAFDANGVRSKIESWRSSGHYPEALAFTADGDWVVTSGSWRYYSDGGHFNSIGLRPALESLRRQGKTIESIAIADNDSWVLVADGRATMSPWPGPQLPSRLKSALWDARSAGRYIHHVTVQGNDWLVLADNWAVASDGFPGLDNLALLSEGHRTLTYGAMSPSDGWVLVAESGATSPVDFASVDQELAATFERDLRDFSATAETDPRYEIIGEMKYHEVPGLQIALIEGGEVKWTRGYGVREAGSNEPVLTSTRFPAASLSKVVAAAMVLELEEKGLLDLDDSIAALAEELPGTDFADWVNYAAEQGAWTDWISPADLLAHTGGLNTHGIGQYPLGDQPEIRDILFGHSPFDGGPVRQIYNPRSAWHYSGGGYTVIESLVEAVTGESFASAARRNILSPLRMYRSTFDSLSPWLHESYARGHLSGTQPLAVSECPGKAAGGLVTTAGNYGRFVASVMNRGTYGSTRVLDVDSVARILRPTYVSRTTRVCTRNDQCGGNGWYCHLSPGSSVADGRCALAPQDVEEGNDGGFTRYGLGVSLSRGGDRRGTDSQGWPWRFSHGGTQSGYRNSFYASGSPARDIGLVILTNGQKCHFEDSDGICRRGSQALISELIGSFKRTYGW